MIKNNSFKNFLVIINPVSTNAAIADRRIKTLEKEFADINLKKAETLPGGRKANNQLLKPYLNILGENALICISGGDGTINMVIEELLQNKSLSSESRKTTILPLWGGNANDLAHMLNGSGRQANMKSLINNGSIIEIYPLKCTLTDDNGMKIEKLAASYVSFGASAVATHVLSNTNFKSNVLAFRSPLIRFINELIIVVPAMSKAPKFKAVENGKNKNIYEYIFFNGPRFAKVNGIKRKLNDQTFHKAIVERKRVSDLAFSVLSLNLRKQSRRMETTHVEFKVLEDTWAQLDGEPFKVAKNTDVEISVNEQPFYALSTRISPNQNTIAEVKVAKEYNSVKS